MVLGGPLSFTVMKENTKIITIALLSPVITIFVIAMVIGVEFLAIAPVAYVIMVLVSLPFLLALNLLFHKVRIGLATRLIITCTSGILGGAAVYLGLFFCNISSGAFSNALLIQYSSIGFTMAFISFLLYRIGPTRIKLR